MERVNVNETVTTAAQRIRINIFDFIRLIFSLIGIFLCLILLAANKVSLELLGYSTLETERPKPFGKCRDINAFKFNYFGSEIPPPPLRTLTGVTSSSVQDVIVIEDAIATRRM